MTAETYMAMSAAGNAIDYWNDRSAAEKWIKTVLEVEPEAADSFVVLGFDAEGMLVETLYPWRTDGNLQEG